jgi:hypothetical protein
MQRYIKKIGYKQDVKYKMLIDLCKFSISLRAELTKHYYINHSIK